jgi:hypothetical protein
MTDRHLTCLRCILLSDTSRRVLQNAPPHDVGCVERRLDEGGPPPLTTRGVFTVTPPECMECMDRGRVWDGPDGDTKPCPVCAVWGVWLTSQIQGVASGWHPTDGVEPARMSLRAAERLAKTFRPGKPTPGFAFLRLWTGEVRRLPEDGSAQ